MLPQLIMTASLLRARLKTPPPLSLLPSKAWPVDIMNALSVCSMSPGFYAKVAQDVVSAEATEHILGRDCFLDLLEPAANIQAELNELVGSAERLLDNLDTMIPEIWQQDDFRL